MAGWIALASTECAEHLAIHDIEPQQGLGWTRTVIHRRFDTHVGQCDDCGRTVQGRRELQTNTARGAAAGPLGPNVGYRRRPDLARTVMVARSVLAIELDEPLPAGETARLSNPPRGPAHDRRLG